FQNQFIFQFHRTEQYQIPFLIPFGVLKTVNFLIRHNKTLAAAFGHAVIAGAANFFRHQPAVLDQTEYASPYRSFIKSEDIHKLNQAGQTDNATAVKNTVTEDGHD